ncbi:DUF6191 domain-containing protein [Streptomyces glaucescens]|uniref:DUF6191 domain-containing protein n=1 Tax=Streptomyces glaucescens TaxID=1907 RepID=UPI0005BB42CC|nr:DUF6191 domain-containing protein [Streptomyces glaucescens]
MFNPFEELFAPGRKHTRDERNRLEMTREDVGDADPGRGPIDLASGKVVVRRPDPEAEPGGEGTDEGTDQGTAAGTAEETPGGTETGGH